MIKKTRDLALLAILMTLNIVLESIYIPLGNNLNIYFTFFITMLVATLFEYPIVAIYAIVEDLLGFFLFPHGSFFPGYTLTALVGLTIYYIGLHNKEMTYPRVLLTKLTTNILANILLNSLWSAILFSKGYYYYLARSFFKNIILCPLEALLFYLFYKALKPLLDKQITAKK